MTTASPFAPKNENPSLAERVAAGIELLDSFLAGEAHALDHIDPDRLDFFTIRDDVLGQVYGTYMAGLAQFGFDDELAALHGFTTLDGEELALADEWAKQLTEYRTRRASAGAPLPRRRSQMAEVA